MAHIVMDRKYENRAAVRGPAIKSRSELAESNAERASRDSKTRDGRRESWEVRDASEFETASQTSQQSGALAYTHTAETRRLVGPRARRLARGRHRPRRATRLSS